MSARPPDAHFGALQQKGTTADATPPHATSTSCRCPGAAGRGGRRGAGPARAPIARKTGTGTLSPMDAYADRREANALTHRQALLIVFGVLLPTFMGSLDQTILATALPTIGRDFDDMHSLPWLITAYLLAS